MTRKNSLPALLFTMALAAAPAFAQTFTVQVFQPSTPAAPTPTSLVSHTNAWRYHRGTNAPVLGWQTNADATLDSSWSTGNGGFGYSDGSVETTNCQTLLPDMKSIAIAGAPTNYSTLYIRQSFEVTSEVDPVQRLILTMDYDDGFVAYLDGVELLRGNTGGTVGVEPGVGALAPVSHESSRGTTTPVNPPSTNDLGVVGSRLAVGTHTLAILGLNAQTNSSDFILIADLAMTPLTAQTPVITGTNSMSIVRSNAVGLFGTNTLAGSVRVTVNGADAAFDSGTGAWSKTQLLTPGCNSLVIEALNGSGATLFSTNHLVVSELSSTIVSSLTGNTVWDSSMGVIRVNNSLTVPANGSLTINAGTVVLLGVGINLRATTNASLTIDGTRDNPVCLLTADANAMWGEIAADGAASHLTVRHAETIGGAVKGRNGAICLLEDSYFHNYKNGSVPIAGCTSAQSMTVRRCHFRVYHETLWQTTMMTIDECLFELANNASSDALDFDGAPPGSVIRRTTFRHGPQGNTDAVDIGPSGSVGSTNTLIADCLMFDFPNDKGVSIGEGSYGIIVSNCFIHGNNNGVQVKDSPGAGPACTANIINCTIVNCTGYGFHCFDKSNPTTGTEGGRITNSYNNILWNNAVSIGVFNDGIAVANHSDIGGGWPGAGNLDIDPLFLNSAEKDYRLTANSPGIGTGRDGATLGAKFPVGSPMAPSHPTISSISTNGSVVKIGFWVDSEKNYTLLVSDVVTGGTWTKVADVYHQMRPRLVEVTNALAPANRFYRLVTPVQP